MRDECSIRAQRKVSRCGYVEERVVGRMHRACKGLEARGCLLTPGAKEEAPVAASEVQEESRRFRVGEGTWKGPLSYLIEMFSA